MAKDILYINNGIAIDAAWTNHIAISNDGTNWQTINKVGLSVGKHYINLNTSAPNSYPERNKESGAVVVISGIGADGKVLKFNPDKVLNQPGWIGDPAVAVEDITIWLATTT
jgi:hypothetical protein